MPLLISKVTSCTTSIGQRTKQNKNKTGERKALPYPVLPFAEESLTQSHEFVNIYNFTGKRDYSK